MKKKIAAISLALVLALSLFACAAGKSSQPYVEDYIYGYDGRGESAEGMGEPAAAPADYAGRDEYITYTADSKPVGGSVVPVPPGAGAVPSSDKIIYYVNAGVETVDFDKSMAELDAIVARTGAFVESSNVSGRDYYTAYYGRPAYRSASYVIRVPREQLENVRASLSNIGYVTYNNQNAQNVTAQYADNESRLKMYRTQEERLLAMLEKADTVADMITIENSLAEVRYKIESLTIDLRNMDGLISYSTVAITVSEVEKITETPEAHRTYGQQITDGLKGTLRGIGAFFKGAVKYVIIALPVIVIVAVVVAAALLIVNKSLKKPKPLRIAEREQDKNNDE
jgi:hypothetical protein